MNSCNACAGTDRVTLAGAEHQQIAIVVVHPTWPWESRGDYTPGQRVRKLRRCGLILSRIADRITELPSTYRFLIGPYINQASYLPQTVSTDILRIERAAVHHDVEFSADQFKGHQAMVILEAFLSADLEPSFQAVLTAALVAVADLMAV